ncbi:MAG: hypothetical protein A2149_07010, partial [Candidatus Schekmanbacteria bacterium RBG_16_38_11]
KIISIYIRNEYERNNRQDFKKPFLSDDLEQIIKQYKPLEPLEKIDNALLNIEKSIHLVGGNIQIPPAIDYPYYHCFEGTELRNLLNLLQQEGLIESDIAHPPHYSITVKGYRRLREIKKPGKESQLCFVAMWFSPEMKEAYEKAIKPAIEYIEEGETQPRYKAVKIDNVEHLNDINDEIISTIRRSRFMVCDLTGYRGGVYFEAGFAYGLGLDIIYTCRQDWVKHEFLKNDKGHEIKQLFDSNGKIIDVRKEGVHFDIEHRNRIDWEKDKLDEFKEKLEKRIKAVIF